MEPRTIITLIASIAILAGVYSIYASIKNTHKNHSQRRAKHRMIQNILGVNGARVFYSLIGLGLIGFGIFILFQGYVKPKMGNEYNNKTNEFTLVSETTTNDDFIINSRTLTTLDKLKVSLEVKGEESLHEFIKASFRNNYMEKVPDFVWKMKNLKFLDLTYNNISEIKVENIAKLDSLKTIILTNNPITKESIEKLRSETNIEIKY